MCLQVRGEDQIRTSPPFAWNASVILKPSRLAPGVKFRSQRGLPLDGSRALAVCAWLPGKRRSSEQSVDMLARVSRLRACSKWLSRAPRPAELHPPSSQNGRLGPRLPGRNAHVLDGACTVEKANLFTVTVARFRPVGCSRAFWEQEGSTLTLHHVTAYKFSVTVARLLCWFIDAPRCMPARAMSVDGLTSLLAERWSSSTHSSEAYITGTELGFAGILPDLNEFGGSVVKSRDRSHGLRGDCH